MKIKHMVSMCVLGIAVFSTGVTGLASAGNLQLMSTNEPSLGAELMQNEAIEKAIAQFASSVDGEVCYSINSAIRSVHSNNDFRFLGVNPVGEIHQNSFSPRTLYQINTMFPFEFMERVNDELIYIAYKVQHGDIKYYKYMFFVLLENADPNNFNSWILSGRTFSISRALSYSDFDNIQIGSTIFDVAEIEPLALVRKPLNFIGARIHETWDSVTGEVIESVIPPPEVIEYTDYFYLTDGILRITFSKPNDPNYEFEVVDIEFDNEFNIRVTNHSGLARDGEVTMQLTILPKDFPVLAND